MSTGPVVRGMLLAAGAGRRYGQPKALVPGWVAGAVDALAAGGCGDVSVVLGASADAARALVPDGVRVVEATDWADGIGASLRAGLRELGPSDDVLVHLVDLPDVGALVVSRVLAAASGPRVLARAAYAGRPGHPVLIGRAHLDAIADATADGSGARDYLREHGPVLVECGDLASGRDVDRPTDGVGPSRHDRRSSPASWEVGPGA